MTLTLGQGHYLTFEWSQIIHHSIRLDEAHTVVLVFFALTLKTKLLAKQNLEIFWDFCALGAQFFAQSKNYRSSLVMIFDELSIAFFRFPLRSPGAELAGGRIPAPPAVRGIWRPPAGRGLNWDCAPTNSAWFSLLRFAYFALHLHVTLAR